MIQRWKMSPSNPQSFSLRSRQTHSLLRKHDQREHGEEAGQSSRRAGAQFMAAPIMGRPEMAASRQISLLAAGDRSTYERCLPVLEKISQNVRLVSEMPWHANLLKLCGIFLLLSAKLRLKTVMAAKQRANADAVPRMSAKDSGGRLPSCHANTAASRRNTLTKSPTPT
jgi:3-hydroxyisobutyrate dehydrogenase-like beta-hydroxyacid dehydrogenase